MSESFVYRSALGYGLVMRALYGRYYTARDAAVAAQIPAGASVLELCCGPARMYLTELRSRNPQYVGLDANAGFVERLCRKGIDARREDVASAQLPRADVVVMQASLYHFLPDAESMVDRMRTAASERVVISEPVRNLASSSNPLLARIGARGTSTAAGEQAGRFDEASLDALMKAFPVRHADLIPGGREKLFVIDP